MRSRFDGIEKAEKNQRENSDAGMPPHDLWLHAGSVASGDATPWLSLVTILDRGPEFNEAVTL